MFRNFLGTQATALAWLPSPPPAASDQEGEQQITNKLLVLGSNRQVDSENAGLIPAGSQQSINLLSVVNLVVTTDSQPDYGSKTKTSAVPEFLASFVHPGKVSTVQVTGAQQAVHVVTGSADGNVAFLRLSIPLSPGSSIDDIDVLEDTPGSPLQSLKLYTSRVSAAQVSPDGNQLLTASTDGALHVSDFPLTLHGDAGELTPFFDSQKHQTFTCAGWATDWVFVTAGTRGPLQCWDVRKGGRPASRSPFDHFEVAGAFARPVSVGDRCASCLSLHPSRPHLCAIGCGQGVALVWDLRFQKMPVACTASAGGTSGQVSCVAFDPMAPEAASVLLFSCRGHPLAASRLSELVNVAEPLVKGSAGGAGSMQCFDVEPTTGDDIIGLADEECLVFIPRRAPQGRML